MMFGLDSGGAMARSRLEMRRDLRLRRLSGCHEMHSPSSSRSLLSLVLIVIVALYALFTCAEAKSAPPSGGSGMEWSGSDAGGRLSRILVNVANGVDGEEVYKTIFSSMRSRGFDLTVVSGSGRVDMPLEEYGHMMLLSNCMVLV